MSKKLFLRVPDPFDSSTSARLERMGILRPDGQVNVETMRTFGSDLWQACSSMTSAISTLTRMTCPL